jgi:hypothetical protein
MSNGWSLPILGLSDRPPDALRVQWKDGTPVASVGILGDFSYETLAHEKAEQEHKQELRDSGVVLLEDFR